MAYVDLPGHRFAYDADGTVVDLLANFQPSGITQPNIELLNSDWGSGYTKNFDDLGNHQYIFLFPQTRSLTGIFRRGAGYISSPAYYSTDTTSGLDGTWTAFGGSVSLAGLRPAYRTSITTFTAITGVKGVRVEANTSRYAFDSFYLYHIHLYGYLTGASDRIAFWHPTNDVEVDNTHFDWGDTPRDSTADVTFRLKNMSSTQSANTITASINAISDTTPTYEGQHTISYDGGAFGASASVGTLSAGSISNTLTLRRTLASNAVIGPYTTRVDAVPASWT